MKLFTCTSCHQAVFFDNSVCTNCGATLAYLPDQATIAAQTTFGAAYRLCANYVDHQVCNWAVAADDPEPLCRACRLNDVIPNLSQPGAMDAWRHLEQAKRRTLYALMQLGLSIPSKEERPDIGLAFSFKKDQANDKVFTGHYEGHITINVAEADNPFREKVRQRLGEQYRTLLGHFRHEIGHYFWDRLVKSTEWLEPFRKAFGDERVDYAEAVKHHYDNGPPGDWPSRFVSAYASMHPWEDWAETWAHYLHMVDTLDTARSFGIALRPKPLDSPSLPNVSASRLDFDDFDDLVNAWFPLTVALNSLNRAMGLPDPYPFVISAAATAKLRFVHQVIGGA